MLARKKLLGEYKIGRTIGEGAFSKVKLATHKVTGHKVAIKVMRKEELENEKKEEREKERKEAQRNPYLAEQMRVAAESSTAQNKDILGKLSKEVKLLMRLDHPNIIKLHQVIETDAEMYIIMEYASGGELIDYIAAKGHLSEREGRKLFRQLISAIDHCHMAGVVHRDLKLENLLLSADKNLRLSDFGLGRTVRTTDQYLNTFCGTPLYAGPELVSGIKYIGPAADIWSMGIVLFIMMAGKPPFKCDTIAELYQQIKAVKYSCPEHFSPELKALLAKILVRNPATRATIEDLRNDPWILKDEKDPVPRVDPKVKVSERKPGAIIDDEIDELIGSVEQGEGFTVYNFHKPDDLPKISGGSDEELNVRSTQGSTAGSQMVDENAAAVAAAAQAQAANRGRRASLAVALSKLNPFNGGNQSSISPTTPSPLAHQAQLAPVVPQQRVRSASIAPGSAAAAAAAAAYPASTPVSPTRTESQAPRPEMLTPLAPTHRRRHSVAVGVPQPGSNIPSNLDGNRGARQSATAEQPFGKPTPVSAAKAPQRSFSGSGNTTGVLSPSSSNTFPSSTISTLGSTGSQPPAVIVVSSDDNSDEKPPVHQQSHSSHGKPQHSRILAIQQMTAMAASTQKMSPSMEQINENEDETTPKHSQMDLSKSPRPSSARPNQATMAAAQMQQHSAHGAGLAAPPSRDRRMSVNEGFGLTSGPGAYSDEMRSVRFGFGVHAASSNVKDPEEIVRQLESVLQNAFLFPKDQYGEAGITSLRRGKWVFICWYEGQGVGKVTFEVEVCKVWLLKMYGIKMKRLGGDALSYKTTYERIVDSLKI